MKQQTEPHYRTGNITKKKHEEKWQHIGILQWNFHELAISVLIPGHIQILCIGFYGLRKITDPR